MFRPGDAVIVESMMAPRFNGSIGVVDENNMGIIWVNFHEGHPALITGGRCCFYPESLRKLRECLWAT